MPTALRIARVYLDKVDVPIASLSGLAERHADLQAIIRRYLSGRTASLLARPDYVEGRGTVDWYTELAGQPVRLDTLDPTKQAQVRERLKERLDAIKGLAKELPKMDPEAAAMAKLLAAATRYPGDDAVYVVGDEPVVTFWGFVATRRKRGTATALAQPSAAAAKRRAALWALFGVLMLAVGAGAWQWFENERHAGLESRLAGILESACARPADIDLLAAELAERDPEGSRYGEIRNQLELERARCTHAAEFAEDLDRTGWDCDRLDKMLRLDLVGRETDREPLATHVQRLHERIEICAEASAYRARLDEARGRCDAVYDLDREFGEPLPEFIPLVEAREALDAEVELCTDAERFAGDLEDNSGQCDALRQLRGQLDNYETENPPFADIVVRLDGELEDCRRARAYLDELNAAKGDCGLLETLAPRLREEDTTREPFRSVQETLDGYLEVCQAKSELERSLEDAKGNCTELAALADESRGLYPRNLFFFEVKRRIAEQMQICSFNQQLEAKLAAAAGNCDALKTLAPEITEALSRDERLRTLGDTLENELRLCRESDAWERRLAAADCSNIESLKGEFSRLDGADAPQFAHLREGLEQRGKACERVATVAAKKREQVQARAEKKRSCPGVRKKEEAPQLAVVFDASGSMGKPLFPDRAREQRLAAMEQAGALGRLLAHTERQAAAERNPSLPTRMDVAKRAVKRVVGEMPSDVDIGLVKVDGCPSAKNAGFYSAGQRGGLLSRVAAMQPSRGTPLASGIQMAAGMIDGVKRKGVVVVISDGEDSCKGNPCLVARQLAQRKPKLVINVVDITGTGAANCAAKATGGKVFTANNAQQLNSMLQRATVEVRGPPECRR